MDRINDNRNAGIEYRVIKDNTHVIHILEIDSKYYRLELVKAHNSVFGRETVPQIAERKGATAAINAGFFEIGNNKFINDFETLGPNFPSMGVGIKISWIFSFWSGNFFNNFS